MISKEQQKRAIPPMKLHPKVKFDSEFALPKCHNTFPVFMESDAKNQKLRINKSTCPAYQKPYKELAKSKEYEDMQESSLWYLIPWFKELIGKEYDFSTEHIGDYCSYIRYSIVDQIDMKFNFTELDDKNCWDLQNAKLYFINWGDEKLWRVGGKAFYDSVLKNMDDVIAGKSELKM